MIIETYIGKKVSHYLIKLLPNCCIGTLSHDKINKMNTLKLAFRKLFRKGEYTTARIISLAVGLAFGLILLGEVFYVYSFKAIYPDAGNLFR